MPTDAEPRAAAAAAAMTLYSGPLSMYGAKVEIALREKGLPFALVHVPFTAEHRYAPRHPEVLRINPKGQVPVLVHGDLELYDSTQIFEYLEDLAPRPALWPAGPAARACARRLEHESDEVFFPHIIRLMGEQQRLEGAVAREAVERAADHYRRLEAQLGAGPFLGGDYGYADIAFYMAQLFAARLGAPMGPQTPRLLDWRRRITARPAVQPVVAALVATLRAGGRAVPAFLQARDDPHDDVR